jgi:hypothetical protein
MENMGTRKFKIKGSDISEIIKRLGIENVIIDLPDTKETYKTLGAFDWDFVGDDEDEVWMGEEETVEEKEKKEEYLGDNDNPLYHLLTDFNSMATYIEACYRVAKKSPGIVFKSNLWTEQVGTEFEAVGSEVLAMDHVLLKTLLTSFYDHFLDPENIKEKDEIISDIDNRISKHWREAQNHPTLISFIHCLYK